MAGDRMKNNDIYSAPDNAAAIKFLKLWNPSGPWVLTTIDPVKKGIETRTFYPVQEDALREWLEIYNGTWNMYFHVNTVMHDLRKKAERTDIKSVDWFHVDIDPEEGQDLEKERDRCLELLTSKLPQDIPSPTVIIFSGGGYQGFWRLEEPILVNGDLELAEDTKRYNQKLEQKFGADNCHNIDRIMRLPGTVNIPGAKKLKKGRKPALAKVLLFEEFNIYPVSEFKKFEMSVQQSQQSLDFESAPTPESIDDLDRWDISPNHKELIITGKWPNQPNRYVSRSEAVFAVVAELVRARAPDNVIEWVITNPSFKISERALEQHNPSKYAQSEIASAREKVVPSKPEIIMVEGYLEAILNSAEKSLINGNIGIYQRGQMLVREAMLDKSSDIDGVRRPEGTSILLGVNKHWLIEKMSTTSTWVKPKKDDLIPCDPKPKYAEHLLGRMGEWNFDVLKGVVNTPTLRKDFSILQTPGYDPASQLIFNPLGYEFPKVPENLTKEEAQAALALILPLFEKFPFTDEASRSVILAALLTALIRRTLKTAPLFAVDAPTAGTGKSLLAEVISILATGNLPAMVSQGRNSEEDQKRLSSILMSGDTVIVIDNCEREISGDFLCSMLTQETLQARILGKSEMILLPSNSLVMATGNNIVLAGDMTRRAVICRIDAHDERPDKRQFDFDPRDKAREQRGELVVAVLTMLRAYHVAGHPQCLPKIGSFETWNIVRETLVWLGCADPAETRKSVLANYPRKTMLIELLNQWDDCFQDRPKTLSQINNICTDMNASEQFKILHQMLIDLSGRHQFNGQSIGSKLRSYIGRIAEGKVLQREQNPHGAQWYVLKTNGERND